MRKSVVWDWPQRGADACCTERVLAGAETFQKDSLHGGSCPHTALALPAGCLMVPAFREAPRKLRVVLVAFMWVCFPGTY